MRKPSDFGQYTRTALEASVRTVSMSLNQGLTASLFVASFCVAKYASFDYRIPVVSTQGVERDTNQKQSNLTPKVMLEFVKASSDRRTWLRSYATDKFTLTASIESGP